MTLKPHQRVGIAWLWHRYASGASGAILADDMGLGKTLQIACFMALVKGTRASARPRRPALIVAPVVLVENWRDELTRFFRDPFPGRLLELRDERLRGMQTSSGDLDRVQLETFNIVITSYETLARYQVSRFGPEGRRGAARCVPSQKPAICNLTHQSSREQPQHELAVQASYPPGGESATHRHTCSR